MKSFCPPTLRCLLVFLAVSLAPSLSRAQTITITDVSVGEAGGTAVFTVSLSAPGSGVSVQYKTANGTAVSGADYNSTDLTTITFLSGETAKQVSVTIREDTRDENDEYLYVNLSNPVNATIADPQGIGTIVDNDPTPTLSVSDGLVTEGNSAVPPAPTITFTVTLSPVSGRPVTVQYQTGNGTADAGSDYTAKGPLTLTYSAGQQNKTVTVSVTSDSFAELDETLFVNLLNPVNATIADGQGLGTITNDDGPPSTLSIGDVALSEGGAGTTTFSFPILLTPAASQAVTVHCATADGTAAAGSDYGAVSIDVMIPAGETAGLCDVPVNGDAEIEDSETFTVTLSTASNAAIGDGQATGTIANDDVSVVRWGARNIFGTTTPIPDIEGPAGYVAGDLNGDGRLDLVAAGTDEGNCRLFILLQDGGGSYPEVSQQPMTGVGEGLCATGSGDPLTLGDVDADGDLDLVAVGQDCCGTRALRLFRNNGAGWFDGGAWIMADLWSGSVALGDVDADGDLDLVASGRFGSDPDEERFIVFRNDGSGNFSQAQEPLGAGSGYEDGSVAFADIDSDGDLDLVVSGATSDGPGLALDIFRNNGGTFTLDLAAIPSGYRANQGLFRLADTDLDSDLDLIFARTFNTPEILLFSNSGGVFQAPTTIITVSAGSLSGITLGDVNGDGFPDLMANGNDGTHRVHYYENQAGTFVEAEQPAVTFTGPILFGDFDGDQDVDMVGLPVRHLYENLPGPANAAPAAPTGLNATATLLGMELTWANATDAETPSAALSYEVRLGTAPDTYNVIPGLYGSPLAGTHPMGRLSSGQPGRRLFLPAGTYYWRACAIDTGLLQGPCSAEASFTTVSVSNTVDSGPGSLREAIGIANNDGGPTRIILSPSLAGQTIQLQSPLPGLYQGGTTIDADFNGDCIPDMELDGSLVNGNGVSISSANNVVRGLAINRFGRDGIYIAGAGATGNVIECNYIGTDLGGTLDRGNFNGGVSIHHGASDNRVGPGNIVAFNAEFAGPVGGIAVLDGTLPGAYPSFSGLTPDYTNFFPLISFPSGPGPFRSADNITPTHSGGQFFSDTFGARFTGTLTVGASGDYTFTIQNPDDLVRIVVDATQIIESSCCSPSPSVTVPLSLGGHAIEIDYLENNGSHGFGVQIAGPDSASLSSGGQPGLFGEVFLLRVASERNRVTRNSIFANDKIGIYLDHLDTGARGSNTNDPGDPDVGPNTALNYPEFNTLTDNGGRSFTVQGTAPPNSTVELFANPAGALRGEGKLYLDSMSASGGGAFTANVTVPGDFESLSATATDALGNTSEFSANQSLIVPRFSPAPIFAGVDLFQPGGFAAGDLNGDGRLDAVGSGQGNVGCRLVVWLQQIDGTFQVVSEPMGPNQGLCNGNTNDGLALGDLDADGDLDIVVEGQVSPGGTPRLLWLMNDGSGVFTTQTDIYGPGLWNGAVAVADMDKDGDLDVIATGGTDPADAFLGQTLIVFANNGSGSFTLAQSPLNPNEGYVNGASLAIGDLDGDGDPDVIAAGGGAGPRLHVFRNSIGQLSLDQTLLVDGVEGLRNAHVRLADLDLDGDLDLVAEGNNNSGDHLVRFENAGGSFASSPTVIAGAPGGMEGLTLGDVNADGFPDLFLNAGVVVYYENQAGTLVQKEQFAANFTGPVLFGDFDGDADLDVATLPPNNGLFRNTQGPANTPPSAPTGLSATPVVGGTLLEWSAASDAQTGSAALSYQLRVGTAPGTYDVISGVYGSPFLGANPMGRVANLPGSILNLPEATYYWRVCAIDTGLLQGPCSAEGTFVVPPSVSIDNITVTEPDAGNVTATFTVSISSAPVGGATVQYCTQNGAAVEPGDYQQECGTVTFPGGSTSSQPITIEVRGDTLFEANETFFVNLSSPSGVRIADAQGLGTIQNDDPSLRIDDIVVTEGNAGTVNAVFTVTLDNPKGPVSVDFFTGGGGAFAGSDFTTSSGTLNLSPGTPTQQISVPVFGDTFTEADETFSVNLSNASAGVTIADAQGLGTIEDDDPAPTLSIGDASIEEPIGGTRKLLFPLFLSGGSGANVTVAYATSNGLAAAPGDYQSASGTFTLSPWKTSYVIEVTVNADAEVEGAETLFVSLSNAAGASILDGQGQGTITDLGGANDVAAASNWMMAQEGMPTYIGAAYGGPVGQEKYVLVGNYGEIWMSPDAVNWTKQASPPGSNLFGIVFGGGQFVAVGAFGRIVTSPDSATWTLRTSGTNARLNGVAFGAGLHVVVGNGGQIRTSVDGVTWTPRTSGTTQALNGVSFGGGQFVAVGSGRTLLTSIDGINWIPQTIPSSVASLLSGVTHTGSQFVVVSRDPSLLGGSIMTSGDGANWLAQAAAGIGLRTVAAGAGNIVAAGGGAIGGANVLVSTDNGVLWTPVTIQNPPGTSPSLLTVTFGAAGFVASGARGNVHTSPDGSAPWTIRALEVSRGYWGVAHDGTRFCAVGVNGSVASSTDGINWANQTAGILPHNAYWFWLSVIHADGLFRAVGRDHAIATSPDCQTWTAVHPPTALAEGSATSFLNDITRGGGLYVAVGETYPSPGEVAPSILTSADGVDWTPRTPASPAGNQWRLDSVAHGNGRFVAFGHNSAGSEVFLTTSEDGVDWTPRPAPFFDHAGNEVVEDVVFAAGQFVAVGERIWTSPDGLAWTLRKDFGHSFVGVAYGDGRFVAVGNNGVIWVSLDAISWVQNTSPSNHSLFAVTHSAGLGRFAAVGDSAIVYSDFARTVSIGNASVTEGNSGSVTATFSVTLSSPSSQTTTVQYATAPGTAAGGGADFSNKSGTLTFSPGQAAMTVTVLVKGDTRDESNESFYVNLSSPTNVALGDSQGLGTIVDDDATPTLSIGNATVTEGNSENRTASFRVALSAASGQTVTVNYATADASATAPSDYTARSGALTFAAGQTSKTVTVTVKGDTFAEPSEVFLVDLSGAVNATLADAQGSGAITNDDGAPPVVMVSDVFVNEPDGLPGETARWTMSTGSGGVLIDDLGGKAMQLVNGASQASPGRFGSEALHLVNPLPFNLGSRQMGTVANAGNGADIEDVGTFCFWYKPDSFDYVGPAASILSGYKNGTNYNQGGWILNDEFAGYLWQQWKPGFTDYVVHRWNGARPTIGVWQNVCIVREGARVDLYLDGILQPGGKTDHPTGYAASANTLLIVGTDTQDEHPTPGQLDELRFFQGRALTASEILAVYNNSGVSKATFTISLAPASAQDVVVSYQTDDGTASAGQDYARVSGSVTLLAFSTTPLPVEVAVIGDNLFEGSEHFFLNLTNATNAAIGDGQGVGTIVDDDLPPVPFAGSLSPVSATPGSGDLTITVRGTNFAPSSIVRRNGIDLTTAYQTPGRLLASIPAADLVAAHTPSIDILNPGGGTSAPGLLPVASPLASVGYVQRTVPTGAGPTGLSVGDVNADGVLDLVVATAAGPSAFAVHLGDGGSSFFAPESYGAGFAPRALDLGDFNRDGILDIVAGGSGGSGTGMLLLGNGDGSFVTQSFFDGGAEPVSVVAADFDRDGALDVALADRGANALRLFRGDGAVGFLPLAPLATPVGPSALIAGDWNGDGLLDLAMACREAEQVSLFLGNGDGTFRARRDSAFAGRPPRSLTAGDWNRDGALDLAVGTDNSNLSLIFGDGAGNFGAPSDFGSASVYSVAGADLNGDQNLDLVWNGAFYVEPSPLYVRFGRGDGTFENPLTLSAGLDARAVRVLDVDGNGRLDVAVANFLSNDVTLYVATAPPSISLFTASPPIGGAPLNVTFNVDASDPDGVIVEYRFDYDGDGVDDATTTEPEASHVYVAGGAFNARITVVDDLGATASATAAVSVSFAPITVQVGGDGRPAPLGGDVNVVEGTGVARPARLRISLSEPTSVEVTVPYWTEDGTAQAPADYTPVVGGTVTFAPGVTEQFVNVYVVGDDLDEPQEDFWFRLGPPSEGSLDTKDRALIVVLDGAPGVNSVADVQWKTTFPNGGTFNGQSLARDAVTGQLFAAPNHRGLYTSTNGGDSWTSLTDSRYNWPFSPPDTLAMYRHDGAVYVVNACCGAGNWIFKSTDNGVTWSNVSSGISGTDWGNVRTLGFDTVDPAVIYAGTVSNGVFKSINAGVNWAATGAGLPADQIHMIGASGTLVYAGTSNSGLFRSDNGGDTFTSVNNGFSFRSVESIAVDPANSQTVYIAARADGYNDGVYKTTDVGANWQRLELTDASLGLGWQGAYLIAIDPATPSTVYVGAAGAVVKTTDGGATWQTLSLASLTRSRVRDLRLDTSTTPPTLYAGAGEGVYKSTDGGLTWAAKNQGLQAINFDWSPGSLEFDAANPAVIYAATPMSSSGGHRSADGGASWQRTESGPGLYSLQTHPALPGVVYGLGNELWKSADYGLTWNRISPQMNCLWQGDLAIHPANPQVLYLAVPNPCGDASEGFYKSTNGGDTWTLQNTGLDWPKVRRIAVDPQATDPAATLIHVTTANNGTSNGGVYKSADGGATWAPVTAPASTSFANTNDLQVSPHDPNLLLLATCGAFYRSSDGGSTWTNVQGSCAQSVRFDPVDPNVVYAGSWNSGTDVYRSSDAGQTWTDVSRNLPARLGVYSIQIDPLNNGRVMIGTSGGAWEADFTLDDPPPTFSVFDVTVGEASGAANFTVSVVGTPAETVTVQYQTADGLAAGGSDYGATSGTLLFPAGSTSSQTVTVPILPDSVGEADETLYLDLVSATGGNARIGRSRGVATITDDDPLALVIDDVQILEGHTQVPTPWFTVRLSRPNPGPGNVTVQWATANGTAAAGPGPGSPGPGSDYTQGSGTLTFPPGSLTTSFIVQVYGDVWVEADETFFVNLSNPVGATITDSQGIGTILNDDSVVPAPGPLADGRLVWNIAQQGIPSMTAAAYGGPPESRVYVLVGSRGKIFTSPDGIGWTQRTTPTASGTRSLSDVHWNGSLFVAVGENCCGTGNGPAILSSPDGIAWTFIDVQSIANGRTLHGVTYASGKWIAVGQSGILLTSADGTTWALGSSGPDNTLRGIALGTPGGSDLFVAVGDNRTLRTSSDGVTWTNRSYPPDANTNLRKVAWSGSRFVVTGAGPMLTSADGTTWETTPDWFGSNGQVAVGAGCVAVGTGSSFRVSSDGGASWTAVSVASDTPNGVSASGFPALTYGPFGFVAGGAGGAIFTSLDGATPWQSRTSEASRYWRDVAANEARLCAVGNSNASAWSTDGINWTPSTAFALKYEGNRYPFQKIAWGAGRFVATTNSASLFTSADCDTWTEVDLNEIGSHAGNGFQLQDVGWGNGRFVAVGNQWLNDFLQLPILFTSEDGANWIERATNLPPGAALVVVTYGNGLFLSIGQLGSGEPVGIVSADGITWTQRPVPFPQTSMNDLMFAAGIFVFAGGGGLWTSPDAENWTGRAQPSRKGLAYGAGVHVAVSGSGGILGSASGFVWNTNTSPTVHDLNGAAHLGRFVAVGDSVILYSSGADAPQIAINDLNVAEGNSGATDAMVPVVLLGGAGTQTVTVPYSTADQAVAPGSAVAPTDYLETTGTVTFSPGQWLAYAPVPVVGDTLGESGESFFVTLGTPSSGALARSPARVFIQNDEPSLVISDGSPRNVTEGDSGSTPVTFTVTLANGPGTDPVTVQYFVPNNGSAVAGLDFEAVTGTLTFNPGETSKLIAVNVFGDTRGENHENFVVNLGTPVGAALMDGQGIATILNDDPAPAVAINDVIVPEGNTDTRTVWFSVSLSSYFDQPISIDYATANGTATAGSDYTSNTGTITIPPGFRSSSPVPISIIGDTTVEVDETFTVTILNARYGSTPIVITRATGTGTITDDEGIVEPPLETAWTLAEEGMPGFNGIASDGSQYLLVGNYGEIWGSTDGINWTQRPNPDRNPASGAARQLRSVTSGPSGFVAVGNFDGLGTDTTRRHPIVLTSPDGAIWTARDVSALTQNTNRNLIGVAYGAGLYVAVGSNNCGPSTLPRTTCILTSPDGANWTYRPAPINVQLNGIAFGTPGGGNLFVAIGGGRLLMTSPDGIVWSQGAVPWEMPVNLNAVTWNGTQFVVVGGDAFGLLPSIMTSPDGSNWTKQTVPPEMLNGFAAVGAGGAPTLTVAVSGANPADLTGTSIVTSLDGVNWTRQSLAAIPAGVSPSLRVVGYGPEGFVAGGGRGGVYASPDGTTPWVSRTLSSSRLHNAVASGGGLFCAVGLSGAISRSTDGVTWTQASSPPDPLGYFQWNPVIFANGQFWTAGRSLSIASSPDCNTWAVRYPATAVLPTDLTTGVITDLASGQIGGNGVLVAVGQRLTTPGSSAVSTPVIFSSLDGGSTWTERTPVVPPGVQQTFVTVAYGNGRFVAFGMENSTREQFLNTSDDGVNWTAHPTDVWDNGSFEEVNDLVYGKGLFVAVADRIHTSPDGINWTLRQNWDSGDYFIGIAYANGRFVAVGNSGVAYVSADGMIWTLGSTPTDHQLRGVVASDDPRHFVAVGDSAIAYTDFPSFELSVSRVGTGTGTVTSSPAAIDCGSSCSARFDPGTIVSLTAFAGPLSVFSGWSGACSGSGTCMPTMSQARDVTATFASLLPTIVINDVNLNEGNAGASLATFTVTLQDGTGPATVEYTTANGGCGGFGLNASAGSDYVAATGSISLSPVTPTQPIAITVNGDTLGEANECFTVNLFNAIGATIGDLSGRGTILNDDPAPTISIGDAFVTEGQSATRTAFFPVSLSSATHQTISVNYATADDSASAGSDYVGTPSTLLTFAAGETVKTIAVTINGDAAPEGDESFFVNLSGEVGASLADGQAVGTITDDETAAPEADSTSWNVAQEGMVGIFSSATNGSIYVLVGQSGDIWTSPDGVSWTRRASPDTTHTRLNAVFWGGPGGSEQFVAVGNCCAAAGGSVVLTSPDGENWTQRSTGAVARSLFGITYGSGLFVAAGSGGRVLTSPDGVVWTELNTLASRSFSGIAFGGGTFVAVGGLATVVTSSDGINWQSRSLPPGGETRLNAVTFTGTQFVAVAQDPVFPVDTGASVYTSPDGAAWTLRSVPTNQALLSVASGGGVIVAVGNVDFASSVPEPVITSTDGINWTRRAVQDVRGVATGLSTVVAGPGGFLAAGPRGAVYTSPDATSTWTSRTLAASRAFFGVANDGTRYCAVGDRGMVSHSIDGVVWTPAAGAPDHLVYPRWNSIIHGNGQFVAVGLWSSIMTSPDCETWTVQHPDSPPPMGLAASNLFDVTFGEGRFVAVGESYPTGVSIEGSEPIILTSPNGVDWTEATPAVPVAMRRGFESVEYGNGRFVAFAEDRNTVEVFLTTSEDGIDWTLQATPFDRNLPEDVNKMAFGEGRFVVVSDRIRHSTDGINWTIAMDYPPSGLDYFFNVAYGGGRFVAVGSFGTTYVSTDGQVWTQNPRVSTNDLFAVAHSATLDRFVAVGQSAIVYGDFPTHSLAVTKSGAGMGTVSSDVAGIACGASCIADYDPVATVTLTATPTGGSVFTGWGGACAGTESCVVAMDSAKAVTASFSVGILISDVSVVEQNTGSTTLANFTISLSSAVGTNVTIQYATASGTASGSAIDYNVKSLTTLTFLPGETSKVVGVTVRGDDKDENDETFFLNLSNPSANAALVDSQGVGTILDDDPLPSLTVSDVTLPEGTGTGSTSFSFTVTLVVSGRNVTVAYSTADGTAIEPGDYTSKPLTTLTFTAGQTSKTVTVYVKRDAVNEANKTFFLNLSSATNAVITDSQGVGTITNDDP